ncbi:hypothetical protein RI367_005332 [Sorochytrium milnesiophthora]
MASKDPQLQRQSRPIPIPVDTPLSLLSPHLIQQQQQQQNALSPFPPSSSSMLSASSLASSSSYLLTPSLRLPPAPPATPVGSLFSPCASLSASFTYGLHPATASAFQRSQQLQQQQQQQLNHSPPNNNSAPWQNTPPSPHGVMHFDPYPRAPHTTPASSFADSYMDHHAKRRPSYSHQPTLPDIDDDTDDEDAPADEDGNAASNTTYICDHCGKVYKHPQCLHKHKWEHSVHWKETAKFYLSKHQQVQLLEAAQILVSLPQSTSSPSTSSPSGASPALPALPESAALTSSSSSASSASASPLPGIGRPRASSRGQSSVKGRERTISLPSAFAATSLHSPSPAANGALTLSSSSSTGRPPHPHKAHKHSAYPYPPLHTATSSRRHHHHHHHHHHNSHHQQHHPSTHDFASKLTSQLEAIHQQQLEQQQPSRNAASASGSSESTVSNSPAMSPINLTHSTTSRSGAFARIDQSDMSVVDVMVMHMDMDVDIDGTAGPPASVLATAHSAMSTKLPSLGYRSHRRSTAAAAAASNNSNDDDDCRSIDTEATEDEEVDVAGPPSPTRPEARANTSYPRFAKIDGGSSAWMAVVASFLIHFVVFGLQYSSGIYIVHYGRTFKHASATHVSLVASLSSGVMFALAFLSGRLADVYGIRTVSLVGTAIIAAGLLAASWASAIWQLWLTQGVMCGVGSSLAFSSVLALPAQWWNKRRALATGLGVSGAGMGGMVWVPVVHRLLQRYGHSTTLRITSGVSLAVMTLACLLIRTRVPPTRASMWALFDIRRIVDYRIIPLCAAYLITPFGYQVPFALLPKYCTYVKLSADFGAALTVALNAASMVGRIAMGYVGGRLGVVNSYIISQAVMAVSTLTLWLFAGASQPLLFAFALVFGFSGGGIMSLIPPILAQMYGLQDLASTLGLLYTAFSAGSLASVPLALTLASDGRPYRPPQPPPSSQRVAAAAAAATLSHGLPAQAYTWTIAMAGTMLLLGLVAVLILRFAVLNRKMLVKV